MELGIQPIEWQQVWCKWQTIHEPDNTYEVQKTIVENTKVVERYERVWECWIYSLESLWEKYKNWNKVTTNVIRAEIFSFRTDKWQQTSEWGNQKILSRIKEKKSTLRQAEVNMQNTKLTEKIYYRLILWKASFKIIQDRYLTTE